MIYEQINQNHQKLYGLKCPVFSSIHPYKVLVVFSTLLPVEAALCKCFTKNENHKLSHSSQVHIKPHSHIHKKHSPNTIQVVGLLEPLVYI